MITHSISWKSFSRGSISLILLMGLLLITGSAQAQTISWSGVLFHFSNQEVGTTSSNQMFSIEGSQLTAPIVVSAPASFQVSLTGISGFGSSVSLAPAAGTVGTTYIYVRYNPAAIGTSSGNLSLTSAGANSVQVAVTGNAVSVKPLQTGTITFGTPTTSDIPLTFTGGTGQKRLVVAHREFDDTEFPYDGLTYTASAVFGQGASLGSGNYVVYNGTGNSVTVTVGSVGNYKFQVYEYNDDNVAEAASYLVPGAEGEQATAANTYTWIGGQVDPNTNMPDNNWANQNNWTPSRVTPNNNDILVFDGTGSTGTITVNMDFPSPHYIGQMLLVNNANCAFVVPTDRDLNIGNGLPGADLYIEAGSAMDVIANNTANVGLNMYVNSLNHAIIAGSVHFRTNSTVTHRHRLIGRDAGSVEFMPGSVFIAGMRSEGSVFGTSGTLNSVVFHNKATYIHRGGTHPFGFTTGPSTVVEFQAGSLYKHEVTGGVNVGGRTYGNLEINHPNFSSASVGVGNFTVDTLRMTQALSFHVQMQATTTIKGDLIINAGNFIINPNTNVHNTVFAGTVPQNITTSGTGTVTFGDRANVQIPAGSDVTLNNNIFVNHALTLTGTLNARNSVIAGSGSFSMVPGASIKTSHAQGLYDWGNQGSVQVSSNRSFSNGHYTYYGTAAQQSGTGFPAQIMSLTLDNAAGLTLSKAVRVNNELNLTSGIINTTATNVLTVGPVAAITGAGSANYVNGPMARVMASTSADLIFPIGKAGSYRPVGLTVDQSATTATTYTAEVMNSAPASRTLPATLGSVSTTRYYTIQKGAGATVTNAALRLIYTTNEGLAIADPYNTRLAMASGTSWTDLGGAYNTAGSTVGTTESFATFGEFVLANGVTPLAVDLISLTAKPRDKKVLVEWATAKEENNEYFDVERSTDGLVFEKIGQVAGQGNTDNRTSYSFIDEAPLAGVAYYRLRQVDTDGTNNFHGPVAVRMEGGVTQLALYPNPAADMANVTFEAGEEQKAQIRILNAIGSTMSLTTISTVKGLNQAALPVDNLKPGMYVVEIVTSTGTASARLIKQ